MGWAWVGEMMKLGGHKSKKASESKSMPKRNAGYMETDPQLGEDEELMRCEKHYENQYGAKIEYLKGPTQTQAEKIAKVLRREGAREGAQDDLKVEEGLMWAMAGKSAQAIVCMEGKAKKMKDQVVRVEPHMAMGPVYKKANEMEKHIQLLTKIGGKPGDSWGAVAQLMNFTGKVVKVICRKGSKKPMTDKEGIDWIRAMQAALDPELDTGEDALQVWARWDEHLKYVTTSTTRAEALEMEKDLKVKAADRQSEKRKLFRSEH